MKKENEVYAENNRIIIEGESVNIVGYNAGFNGCKKRLFIDNDQSENYIRGYAQGHRRGYKLFLANSFIKQQRLPKDNPEAGINSQVDKSEGYCDQSTQYPVNHLNFSNKKRKERPGVVSNLNSIHPTVTEPIEDTPLIKVDESIEQTSSCNHPEIQEEEFNLTAVNSHNLSLRISALRSYNNSIEANLSCWAELSPLYLEQIQKLLKQISEGKKNTDQNTLHEGLNPLNVKSHLSSLGEHNLYPSLNSQVSPLLNSLHSDMNPHSPPQQGWMNAMCFFNNGGQLPQEYSQQYDERYCQTSETENNLI